MEARGGQRHDEPRQLLISIQASPGADRQEVERLSSRLRMELLQLDVESVTRSSGPEAPQGSKAGDPYSWSTLVLTLTASGGVLTTVIGALRDWLLRQPTPQAIEVSLGGDTIRLEGSTTRERRQLIEAFVARHDGEAE